MKQCKYCNAEIEDQTMVCPHCHKPQKIEVWKIVAGIVIALSIVGGLMNLSQYTKQRSNSNPFVPEGTAVFDRDTTGTGTPDLEIVEASTEQDRIATYITGTIRNNSQKTYNNVRLNINLYQNNTLVDSTFAMTFTLKPNDTQEFRTLAIMSKFNRYTIDIGIQ